MLDCVRVFVMMFLLDFIWAIYVAAIAKGHKHTAGITATLVYVLGGLITLQYVDNPWLLVPAGLGAYAGTFTQMWLKKNS